MPRAPGCSGRTSRCTPRRATGCAWRIARPASMARSIPVAWCWSGAIGKARRWWSAVRRGEEKPSSDVPPSWICAQVWATSSRSTSVRCIAISIAATSACCGTQSSTGARSWQDAKASARRAPQRSTQVAAELLDEVDRDARVDATLAVQKLRLIGERHDRSVPDVRMQIKAAATVAEEGDESIRRDVVAWQCKRYHEPLAVERVEELAAVGVIVGTPDQGALAHPARGAGRLLFGPVAPTEQVAVADCIVARVQSLALPAELEQAFDHAALVAAVRIDRAPSLGRPADDLDRERT